MCTGGLSSCSISFTSNRCSPTEEFAQGYRNRVSPSGLAWFYLSRALAYSQPESSAFMVWSTLNRHRDEPHNNGVFCLCLFQISCFTCWPCTCVCTASIQPTTPGRSWLRLYKLKRQSEWRKALSTSANRKSINLFICCSYLLGFTGSHTALPPPIDINMQSECHFVLSLNTTISSCPQPLFLHTKRC